MQCSLSSVLQYCCGSCRYINYAAHCTLTRIVAFVFTKLKRCMKQIEGYNGFENKTSLLLLLNLLFLLSELWTHHSVVDQRLSEWHFNSCICSLYLKNVFECVLGYNELSLFTEGLHFRLAALELAGGIETGKSSLFFDLCIVGEMLSSDVCVMYLLILNAMTYSHYLMTVTYMYVLAHTVE